jgi:hypothetical protein
MPPIQMTSKGVQKLLAGLDPSKARGPDQLPTRVLKEAAEELAPMLTAIFQKSYDTHEVPADWKMATINAVFKKGSKTDAANYRPVSLTSVCCKLMEDIVQSNIMQYLNSQNILVNYQHGFRTGHSCETQLIQTLDEIANNMKDKLQTDLIVLDFSKAFVTVPHHRLLAKMRAYHVEDHCLQWIMTWLSGRTQTVVLDGKSSSPVTVRSGVPQGTVLGPLLFLMFVNDIGLDVTSSIKLFADDCLLYRAVKTQEDCSALQYDNASNVGATWQNLTL